MSLFNNFCCINNMLSIRFFLDNILPAARKQRFRKASKGSFDTPSIKSKKGFCAGKKRNVLRWKRHFPLRKGKTFPTDKENPVFCKRGFPILREKRQSERVVDTEVEIQIPVVAAEGIADVGKTVQLFCEVHAAADDHPSQRHVLQSADAAETGYPHVTVAERLNHARFDEQFGVTVAVLKRFSALTPNSSSVSETSS